MYRIESRVIKHKHLLITFPLLLLITPFVIANKDFDNHDVNKNNLLVVYADSMKEYWLNDTEAAFKFGELGNSLSPESYSESDRAYFDFVYGITCKNAGKRAEAYNYLEHSLSVFNKKQNWNYYHRVNEQLANMYREDGQGDTAIRMLEASLAYYRDTDHKKQINSVLINLGSAWLDKGRNHLALNAYNEALKLDSLLGDTSTMALSKMGIGIVYDNLGKIFLNIDRTKSDVYFDQGLASILESRQLFESIGHRMGVCYAIINEAGIHYHMGNFEKMDDLISNAYSCQQLADEKLVMEIRYLKAMSLKQKGMLKDALLHLSEVATLGQEKAYPHIYHDAMLDMSQILYDLKQSDSAYRLAIKSAKWLMANGNFVSSYKGSLQLIAWALTKNDKELIIEWQQIASSCKDSIFKEAANELFDDLNLKYQNTYLKSELKQMEASKTIESRNLFISKLLVVLLFMGLLVAGLIFFIIRKKHRGHSEKLKLQLFEVECSHKSHQVEYEKIRLENEILEQKTNVQQLEVQLKQQEMMYQSIKQADLLQLNKSIRERLSPFKIRFSKKKDQEDFEKLLDEISGTSNLSALNDFDSIFKQMHGDFYEKLLANATDLTPAELQMCALLRINLSSKEIARLMSLSKATIDLTRHHIRQKLNLDSTQNLTSYLIVL